MEDGALKRWESIPALNYDPLAAAAEIGDVMRQWFAPAFVDGGEPLPDHAEFQHLFCGLVSLADWLGSDRRVFAFVPELDPKYMSRARAQARSAIAEIGLDVGRWLSAISGRQRPKPRPPAAR